MPALCLALCWTVSEGEAHTILPSRSLAVLCSLSQAVKSVGTHCRPTSSLWHFPTRLRVNKERVHIHQSGYFLFPSSSTGHCSQASFHCDKDGRTCYLILRRTLKIKRWLILHSELEGCRAAGEAEISGRFPCSTVRTLIAVWAGRRRTSDSEHLLNTNCIGFLLLRNKWS